MMNWLIEAEQILLDLEMEPHLFRHCAKISVIGAGIAGVPGVMARIVEALNRRRYSDLPIR